MIKVDQKSSKFRYFLEAEHYENGGDIQYKLMMIQKGMQGV